MSPFLLRILILSTFSPLVDRRRPPREFHPSRVSNRISSNAPLPLLILHISCCTAHTHTRSSLLPTAQSHSQVLWGVGSIVRLACCSLCIFAFPVLRNFSTHPFRDNPSTYPGPNPNPNSPTLLSHPAGNPASGIHIFGGPASASPHFFSTAPLHLTRRPAERKGLRRNFELCVSAGGRLHSSAGYLSAA